MRVVVGSMFRDSTGYLPRYFDQMDGLRQVLESRGDHLRVILVENNSVDDTWETLDRWCHAHFADGVVVQATDDCPYHKSQDFPERWRHHAWVINHALTEIRPTDDVFIWVESDLIWVADDLVDLIDLNLDVVGPRVMKRGRYYDTWGSRKDGVRFTPRAPYHPALSDTVTEMDSLASCLVMRADVARQARFQPEDAHLGFCREARQLGYRIWMDPRKEVFHP